MKVIIHDGSAGRASSWRSAAGAIVVLLGMLAQSSHCYAFANRTTVHTPDANQTNGDHNPRVVELPNGHLIATHSFVTTISPWSNTFFLSTDNGSTWTQKTTVLYNGVTVLKSQDILVTPIALGGYAAGTLFFVGTLHQASMDSFELYASTDEAQSWTHMSRITTSPSDSDHLVTEAHIMVDKANHLICYYSDKRDYPNHRQKIVRQGSSDGGATDAGWGAVADITVSTSPGDAPGMPRTAKMGNGQYILVYQGWSTNPPGNMNDGIYFKTSTDGYAWGSATAMGTRITDLHGIVPVGSAAIAWTPGGSANGTLILSTSFESPRNLLRGSDNFVNYNYGVGNWYHVYQPLTYDWINGLAWSRTVTASASGAKLYHINCVNYIDSPPPPATGPIAQTVFASTPSDYTPGYVYYLMNKTTNKLLQVTSCSTSDSVVNQYSDDFATGCQEWTISDSGTTGYVKIINGHSGKALGIQNGSIADHALAYQKAWANTDDQKWQIIPTNDGFYKVKNKKSGMLLSIVGCSSSSGANAEQRPDGQSICQSWQLQYVRSP